MYIAPTMSNPVKQSLLSVVTKEHYLEINTEMIIHILQRSIDNCCIMRGFFSTLTWKNILKSSLDQAYFWELHDGLIRPSLLNITRNDSENPFISIE